MTDTGDPEYLLGDTHKEVERLQRQHAWIQTCLDGRIIFAPADLQKENLKILDVGCADGTLLRDLQKQVPKSAKLVGVDITPSFLPKGSQDGIQYAVADVCEPPAEELKNAFDITHVRYLLAGTARVGVAKAISNLAETLAPGGWLQIQEMDLTPNLPDQSPATQDVMRILGAMFDKIGVGAQYSHGLPEMFEKAGLQNVVIKTIKLGIGKRQADKEEARKSIAPFKLTIPSITGATKGLGVDLPDSVYDGLEDRFEKEAIEQGTAITSFIVYGQKKL